MKSRSNSCSIASGSTPVRSARYCRRRCGRGLAQRGDGGDPGAASRSVWLGAGGERPAVGHGDHVVGLAGRPSGHLVDGLLSAAAPITVMPVTRVRPIVSAEAVAAVRRGLRTAFCRASLPDTPNAAQHRRGGAISGRDSSGVRTNTPISSSTAPQRQPGPCRPCHGGGGERPARCRRAPRTRAEGVAHHQGLGGGRRRARCSSRRPAGSSRRGGRAARRRAR